MASVGKHIRRIRTEQHMTQEQLAEKLFVTRQAVSSWETGKSQPDVETLERIAAALDVDVTEVIYGVSQSPNLRQLKRRWALIGGVFSIIIFFSIIIMSEYGVFGTYQKGLQYQFWEQNYSVDFRRVTAVHQLQLDLKDLDSNIGKVLYEDDTGCRVTVQRIETGEFGLIGEASVTFLAEGVCTPAGGVLVSGCRNDRQGKYNYNVDLTAALSTTIGDFTCPPARCSMKSSLVQNSNRFGFYLFPADAYDENLKFIYDEELEAANHLVTVTVVGLNRMTTHR